MWHSEKKVHPVFSQGREKNVKETDHQKVTEVKDTKCITGST